VTPTQAPHLIRALHAFDPQMRWRWATHGKHWVIELKMPERQPAWLLERPNPFGHTNRAKDTWDGYKEGYLYVTKMKHPVEYPWAFIAEHLRHLSLEAHAAKDRLIDRLDAAEAEEEARNQRAWNVINEQGAKELYDRLQWDNKRAISTHVAGPNPLRHEHDGYVVYDRRTVNA